MTRLIQSRQLEINLYKQNNLSHKTLPSVAESSWCFVVLSSYYVQLSINIAQKSSLDQLEEGSYLGNSSMTSDS